MTAEQSARNEGMEDEANLSQQSPRLSGGCKRPGGHIQYGEGVHAKGGTPAPLKAPFPYFGGKRSVAALVWSRLGRVDNYIEPFFGSGAVLLLRPDPPRIETANDLDSYVANFWRATQADPEQVAAYADSPVSEVDLHSRHRWLVLSDDAEAFRQRTRSDPEYYDAKVAGWWCWGLCAWIGSGWCESAKRVQRCQGQPPAGASQQTGVHAKGEGSAAWQQMPQLADAYSPGRGVHAGPLSHKVPRAPQPTGNNCGGNGTGVHSAHALGTCADRRAWLLDWFGRLRDRLRNVRVCCGDWSRVCSSESVTTRLGLTGVFLDPPYSDEAKRCKKLYAQESGTVAHDVRRWCIERGPDPMMRIALCGYAGEGHEELEAAGWEVVSWQARGGYGNRSEKGRANAGRERIWFSPHCLRDVDCPLFAGLE